MLELSEVRLAVADAELQLRGRFDTQSRAWDGSGQLSLPGAQGVWRTRLAHDRGQGQLGLKLTDAARTLAWLRSLQALPLIGPALSEALAPQARLALEGKAELDLSWTGGLGALGYPAGAGQAAASAVPKLALDAPLPGGGKLHDIAKDVLAISRSGLAARARINTGGDNETGFLDPLEEIVASGKVPAQRLLDCYNGEWAGDISQVYKLSF